MSLSYMEVTCPSCGAKKKENCNSWGYGSPIKICPDCNTEFIDRRFTEPAVEGLDRRSTDPSLYFKGMLLMLVFTVICSAILYYMHTFSGRFPTKLIFCIGGGILGTILCGIMFFRIKFGFADKENNAYLEESESRLQNREYAEKLRSYGYNVPEKYL